MASVYPQYLWWFTRHLLPVGTYKYMRETGVLGRGRRSAGTARVSLNPLNPLNPALILTSTDAIYNPPPIHPFWSQTTTTPTPAGTQACSYHSHHKPWLQPESTRSPSQLHRGNRTEKSMASPRRSHVSALPTRSWSQSRRMDVLHNGYVITSYKFKRNTH